ncbi:MAG: hypothetical protein M0024_01675 [Nitrospiraceae bacterium]|nr:hypothetical protein [Nitrospiraceae bacterium]
MKYTEQSPAADEKIIIPHSFSVGMAAAEKVGSPWHVPEMRWCHPPALLLPGIGNSTR